MPYTKGGSLAARIDAFHDRTDWQDPTRRTVPSQAVLDRIADEAITGKYVTKPGNLCPDCFQYRSRSGTCGC